MLSHSPTIISSGLIFCVDPMNKRCYSAGTTLQELSKSRATGVLVNGVAISGGSFFFDGVNDYITFGDILDFSTGNSIAIDVWCKRSATGIENIILSKFGRTGAVQSEDGWLIRYYLSKIGYTICKDATYHHWQTTGVYTDTNWNHLCFNHIMGSGSSFAFYFNGVITSGSWTTGNGTLNIEENPYDLRIGDYLYTGTDQAFFYGNIGIIKVYNRPLTSGEVYQNYMAHRSRYVSG